MFEEIAIEVDGSIVHAPMQQPFAAFHDEGFRGWIMDGAKTNPSPLPDRGSNEALLVEAMGLEPTTPCLQSRCSSQLSYAPKQESPCYRLTETLLSRLRRARFVRR